MPHPRRAVAQARLHGRQPHHPRRQRQAQTHRSGSHRLPETTLELNFNVIARALAKHYGFTDEELDFIINYDIKYRMGSAGAEASDDV